MPNKKLILSKLESSFNFQYVIPPITSITFFQGNLDEVASQIKKRWQLIIEANPWLSGKLIKNKDHKRLQLVYSDDSPISKKTMDELFLLNPLGLKVHDKTPYQKLLEDVKIGIVKNGHALVNKPHPVVRLTLVADAEKKATKFALLFSMSHIVADGHCYYNILNMLSADGKIEALNAERKEEAIERIIDSVGRKEWGFINSAMISVNFMKGILFGKKPKIFGFYVDDNEINALKKEVKENEKPHFISTNDIITSRVFNFFKARLGLMLINLRVKLSGIINLDSGNYEAVVTYDKPGYTHPSDIRKSLNDGSPYLGIKNPLPGFFEAAFCKLGIITNWATFGKELALNNCEEILHLPLFPTNVVGSDFAIIFRPKQGKTGLIFCTKKYTKEDYENSEIPIRGLVSEDIFRQKVSSTS